jgi:hypothetical protein
MAQGPELILIKVITGSGKNPGNYNDDFYKKGDNCSKRKAPVQSNSTDQIFGNEIPTTRGISPGPFPSLNKGVIP